MHAARVSLGLRPDRPTGLILFGGAGSTEIERIVRLLNESNLDVQLIALCGHNHRAVDAVRALMPQLQRWIPSGINLSVLSDRTDTIRASVSDVQFTLLLTIVLVVAIVFIFLRKFWSTFAAALTGLGPYTLPAGKHRTNGSHPGMAQRP